MPKANRQPALAELDAEGKRLLQEFAEKTIPWILEQAIRDGRIDPRGKSEEQVEKEFVDFLGELLEAEEGEVLIVTDYTDSLLREARRSAKRGTFEFACLLYATWVEHWLNQMIVTAAARRGLTDQERTQALRRLAARHQKALIEIGELRNTFVHYKWRRQPLDDRSDKNLAGAVRNIDKTITYLRRFERREVFGGHQTRRFAKRRSGRTSPGR
jgi:hypothetical protein